jgi:hypothetical protein
MDELIRGAVMAEIGKTKKKRLKMDAVWGAVQKQPMGPRSDFEIQKRINETLEAMAGDGLIRLPSSKKSWDRLTGLPNFVDVNRSEEDTRNQQRRERIRRLRDETAWEPTRMVEFAYKLSKLSELKTAVAVNHYLKQRRADAESIPHRERALEIFGDEKALDPNVRKGLLGGRISLADLDCFYCPEPLPFHSFSLNARETRGLPLLVVENGCTYWSCCRANDSLRRYAAVVYGKGFEACASDQGTAVERASDGLRGIEAQVGAAGIRYFGDLDPTGLVIPRRINRYREKEGLPPMSPEIRLYKALLDKDRATPCIPAQAKDHDPDWAREWLGEELAGIYLSRIADVRWPQEGVTAKGVVDILDNFSC